ncbi:hypothetical protein BS47DRAFT_966366 [Hydnum rufescens UP504]|uniref:Uncharacterized protein n=1 Tax=Hydnum rufescens UP504 TaxID=1448309 RepID=A0A9P6DW66_9AGAM|nr:hypothetical protein BS47DRAFT_966366 [Hydnum rufescens UP504]
MGANRGIRPQPSYIPFLSTKSIKGRSIFKNGNAESVDERTLEPETHDDSSPDDSHQIRCQLWNLKRSFQTPSHHLRHVHSCVQQALIHHHSGLHSNRISVKLLRLRGDACRHSY